jgi:uncharacterized protein YbjT (DUF2867 family)
MYAVIGATGNTGKIVADTLLANGKKVRVIGRDIAKLKYFGDKGAEVIVGSVEDTAISIRSFAGCEAVYAMIPPNLTVKGFREYQNRVANAIAMGLEANAVKYVVALSSLGADRPDKNGPVGGLYDMEQRFNKVKDLNALYLRPTFFMENQMSSIGVIKMMGVNGSAMRSDIPFPMIASKDIGDYAAKRLISLDFKEKSFQDLLGQRDLTLNEVTQILGKAIGMPDLKYVQFSYEDTFKGMTGMGVSEEMAKMYVELSQGANEGFIKASGPRDASNTTPTTFEEFAKVFAAAYNR